MPLRVFATCFVLIVVGITVSGIAVSSLSLSASGVADVVRADLSLEARRVANAVRDAVAVGDPGTVRQTLGLTMADPSMAFAAVYNRDGRLMASTVRDPVSWELHRREPGVPHGVIESRVLVTDAASEVIGAVVLARDAGPVRRILAEHGTLIFGVFAVVAGLSIVGVSMAVRRFGRQIDSLTRVIEQLAEGHSDAVIPTLPQRGDLARLGVAVAQLHDAARRRSASERHVLTVLHQEAERRADELENLRRSADEARRAITEMDSRSQGDSAERRRVDEDLERTRERFALAALGAGDGLWDWDRLAETIHFSPRWKQILGYEEDDLEDCLATWFDRVHSEDLPPLRLMLEGPCDQRTRQFEMEHRLLHREGNYRWVFCRGVAMHNDQGDPIRLAGSLTDIHTRKEAEAKLRHQAFHDSLTGLPNRALLLDRINQCILRSKRQTDTCFAVFHINLDRFKIVNNSLGHAGGDQLLIEFANRLRGSIRASDTVSRVGGDTVARLDGDQFVLLLDFLRDREDVVVVAERFRKSLARPFEIQGETVYATGSIGVAIGGSRYARAEDVLRDADMAMFHAKAAGRDRFEVFQEEMRHDAIARTHLESDLRQAIDHNQLSVRYQPIVQSTDGRIVGFEALARWNHPTRGSIPPMEFIGVAEETGYIVSLGAWVLQQACEQLAQWRREMSQWDDLTISVNLSKRQVREPGLVDIVRKTLERTGLPPERLNLEMTESVISETSEDLIPILQQLRDMGCRLHMDDFGTGYSSLSVLHRFPLDVIKVDRAFVMNLGEDERYEAVISTIVNLAHSLNMLVTAEGVETAPQLSQIIGLKADFCQGFFFARPMDPDEAGKLLESPQPPWSDAFGPTEPARVGAVE